MKQSKRDKRDQKRTLKLLEDTCECIQQSLSISSNPPPDSTPDVPLQPATFVDDVSVHIGHLKTAIREHLEGVESDVVEASLSQLLDESGILERRRNPRRRASGRRVSSL